MNSLFSCKYRDFREGDHLSGHNGPENKVTLPLLQHLVRENRGSDAPRR